jgi:AsmA protein
VRAAFAADGAKVSLKEATIEGKAVKANATGSFDGSKPVAAFKADIDVVQMDLNSYLPPSKDKDTKGKKKAARKPKKTAAKEPAGWSEEPLDLTPLSKAKGDIKVKIAATRYGDLLIKHGLITAALAGGVLKTSIDELKLAEGTIGANATLGASGQTATVEYQISVAGVEARPLLKTFAGTDRLSGKAEFEAKGKARGRNQKELVKSLNGDGRFKFLDGAIHGINLAAALRKTQTLGFGDTKAEKTDFAELSGSFVIKNGVLDNRDFKMLAPVIRLAGQGVVPMPPRTIDYQVEAKLVPSLKGQGGQDAIAGLPIPIKLTGPWENVAYKVDWKSVFSAAAKDPTRLKNMPEELRNIGKNFGAEFPVPKKFSDVIGSVPGLSKGKDAQDQSAGAATQGGAGSAVDQLKGLIQPKTEPSTEEPKEEKAPSVPDPVKSLKGLFGR